jgi:4-amino-4-deoxy-L-arabinose transferase-like glycosyltransferase
VRTIWLVFFATLGVRLLAMAGTYTFGTDSAAFLRMAEQMREGAWHEALETYYHPGYPAAVALFSHLTGDFEWAGYLVSMLFGSLAAIPLYLLARDAVGRSAALIAVTLYAFHYALVDLHTDVMTEGLYYAALFGAIWLGRAFLDSRRLLWAMGAGVAASVAYLTRNEGVIAIAGLSCWFLFEAVRRRDRSSGALVMGTVLAGACFLICSMPYLNWVRGELGEWGLSPKGSARAATGAIGGESIRHRWGLTNKLLYHFARLHFHILLVPLVVGLALAWKESVWKRLYLVSWPVVYLLAVGTFMHRIGYVSYRYIIPSFCLLLPFLALGLLKLVSRMRPPARAKAAVALTLVATLVVGFKVFDIHRYEDLSLVRAGEWIRTDAKRRPLIMTTRDKVVWYAKGTMKHNLEAFKDAQKVDYVVFGEDDQDRPEWQFIPEMEKDGRFQRIPGDFTGGDRRQKPVRVYRVVREK